MPRKPPIDPVRWTPPPVGALPDFPPAELTVVPMPGDGPEDVVVDATGQLWTGLVDGRIVRVTPDGSATVMADTGGRPLGMHVARDGRVLICDSHRGLLALDPTTGALSPLVESVGGGPDGRSSAGPVRRPLRFCSNVTETSDGSIYFTESTSRFHFEYYQGAILEARGTGSLFRLAPDGTVTTLVEGLYFANGVTPTADESALVFAETQGRRLSKYWLSGPAAGTVTPLAEHLPGMPDNISTAPDGRIWVALVSPIIPAAERLAPLPPVLRKVVWRLPDALLPKIKPEVWVVAFDAESGEAVAGIRTQHPAFGAVTGVVETGGKLWMSTIGFPALANTQL
ncbi:MULTISPECIES: SMP-30/gluconolactonase/LRE family protein [unclassified Mycolicibacterium]|uniref:SMP-30/gluconolactonase/LRE family protein n=1 Tax=unclassified Mycolicibacterium TaxID=2636767 RepID=UPI002EDB6E7F